MKIRVCIYITVGALCLSLTACKKDKTIPIAQLTITGFNPTHGFTGDTVIISGTEFTADDNVYFNGAPVKTIISATATQLRCVVPDTATSGTIQIKQGNATATSSSSFIVDHLIYVCGSDISGHACYWKNDTEVVLTDGSKSAIANSIYVSGKNVYVAGNDGSAAVYWKNGIETPLTNGVEYAYARSIYVSDNDIYVAGNTPDNGNLATDVATYWKNGAGTPVYLANGSAYANSICISGNDVYVTGSIGYSAVYWKNGTAVNLPGGLSSGAVGQSIYISGNDVYVAGNQGLVATYWKNGTAVNLALDAIANSIYVSNSDVYVAGYKEDIYGNETATYWKNNDEVDLSSGSGQVVANSIYVSGGDVYVAGQETIATYPYNYVAKYWKNGTAVILSSGGQSTAMSLFVR